MNEKLISRLVLGALVGLAATGAYAGQIQASSVSIAREVITTDTQSVTSPSISYRFAGDIDARLQAQTFQVQFNLDAASAAIWNGVGLPGTGSAATQPAALLATGVASAPGTFPLYPQLSITDGVSGARIFQKDSGATVNPAYSVTAMNLSADKKTLYATIVVNQNAGNLIKQPLISISTSTVAGDNPTVKNLYSTVGAVAACDTAVKTLPVSFQHFTALAAPASLATTANATADEHVRGGATNTATLITFPTNIKVLVTKSGGNAKIDVGAGNSLIFAATPTAGLVAPTYDSYTAVATATTLVNLGNVSLVQQASGYDSNLANQYLLAGAGAGLVAAGASASQLGVVEQKGMGITVSASQGFVVGGVLSLNSAAACTAGATSYSPVTVTSTNAAGPIALTLTGAELTAITGVTGTSPIHVCYNVAGVATPIPGSSFTIDAAVLSKADQVAPTGEQNNSCNGPLYALSGSIKIDVRNYASNSRADGWMSIIRLINNSETRTTNVYGQYIHSNGQYGKWGKIATLAPRAVLNMTPAQVDAALTSAPAHATTANNATTPVDTNGDAPRLRITSNDGNTLRVQNYLYNPASQNFIEASSSQGVDFTGSTDRAPANEGQYQDQDAQKGLNGGN